MDTSKMVFVFGSNEGGIHGAGAARYAMDHKFMDFGRGYGHCGNAFAIPTKGAKEGTVLHTLPLETINTYVQGFLAYAKGRPDLQFQITCIGCGLAGLRHTDIAPMFKDAPDNCYFDNLWFPYLTTGGGDNPQHRYWGTF